MLYNDCDDGFAEFVVGWVVSWFERYLISSFSCWLPVLDHDVFSYVDADASEHVCEYEDIVVHCTVLAPFCAAARTNAIHDDITSYMNLHFLNSDRDCICKACHLLTKIPRIPDSATEI